MISTMVKLIVLDFSFKFRNVMQLPQLKQLKTGVFLLCRFTVMTIGVGLFAAE